MAWSVRGCCIGCPRGPSQRGCEQATGGGSSRERWLEQAPCVHTTSAEGVTRGDSAAARPRVPAHIGLLDPWTVDRVSLGYLSAGLRYTTDIQAAELAAA